jgi:hypothetical protein
MNIKPYFITMIVIPFFVTIILIIQIIDVNGGGGGRGGGVKTVYKEVVKEILIDVNENKFEDRKPKLCFLLKSSVNSKCLAIGNKRSGKSSALKYIFKENATPEKTVHDGTKELLILGDFIDSIGAEVSIQSVSKLLVGCMAYHKIFPKCYLLIKPDNSLYMPGLNELLYSHLIHINVVPIDFLRMYDNVDFDTSFIGRLARWIYRSEPERTTGIINIFVELFNSKTIDEPYLRYINHYVYDHIKNHNLLNVVIRKEDFTCEETSLQETLLNICDQSFKEFNEGLSKLSPLHLLFGNMLRSVASPLINKDLSINPSSLRAFVNTRDEL